MLKDFMENAQREKLSLMINLLESLYKFSSVVGEQSTKTFLKAVASDEASLELVRDCAKIYKKERNMNDFENISVWISKEDLDKVRNKV